MTTRDINLPRKIENPGFVFMGVELNLPATVAAGLARLRVNRIGWIVVELTVLSLIPKQLVLV